MALFSFILALQIAYMVVGQTADVLMGVRFFDAESGDYDKYPRYRAHITAVVFSRFAVIASLASFVALMRCDPVGAEEEVRSVPLLVRVFGWLGIKGGGNERKAVELYGNSNVFMGIRTTLNKPMRTALSRGCLSPACCAARAAR